MKFLNRYLWDRRRLLFAIVVLAAEAAFLFYLYDMPAGPLLYTGLVCGVTALVCFAIPGFASWTRKVGRLESMQRNLSATLDFTGCSDSLPEQMLSESCGTLCRDLQDLESRFGEKQKDTLEYYTLWVHQVKTPLSAMRLILQSAKPEDGNKAVFDSLAQELFKVERYVEMVLGYLRLDSMSSDLRLENLPVYPIVKQAVKKFAPQFIYKKLALDLKDFDNRVITDEKWLGFVVEQLLSNALKYTCQGAITIFMDENDVLTIRDTGAGISQDDLPRIFERGFTGHNGRVDKTASGLGLYLTKQILDRLQNRVEIDSAPGKGTEVRVYLHRGQFNVY